MFLYVCVYNTMLLASVFRSKKSLMGMVLRCFDSIYKYGKWLSLISLQVWDETGNLVRARQTILFHRVPVPQQSLSLFTLPTRTLLNNLSS